MPAFWNIVHDKAGRIQVMFEYTGMAMSVVFGWAFQHLHVCPDWRYQKNQGGVFGPQRMNPTDFRDVLG